eukprot:TRINITY_DN29395_c0_g3_i2.p1 TRINITY_DN29395_c0_g3~~TRINITY_DN29395_c0_g3_i2.p1  ORF type:complete len:451 (+),score=69.83 TRINITY_DN29395_c0_g3_i2:116-1468(+)
MERGGEAETWAAVRPASPGRGVNFPGSRNSAFGSAAFVTSTASSREKHERDENGQVFARRRASAAASAATATAPPGSRLLSAETRLLLLQPPKPATGQPPPRQPRHGPTPARSPTARGRWQQQAECPSPVGETTLEGPLQTEPPISPLPHSSLGGFYQSSASLCRSVSPRFQRQHTPLSARIPTPQQQRLSVQYAQHSGHSPPPAAQSAGAVQQRHHREGPALTQLRHGRYGASVSPAATPPPSSASAAVLRMSPGNDSEPRRRQRLLSADSRTSVSPEGRRNGASTGGLARTLAELASQDASAAAAAAAAKPRRLDDLDQRFRELRRSQATLRGLHEERATLTEKCSLLESQLEQRVREVRNLQNHALDLQTELARCQQEKKALKAEVSFVQREDAAVCVICLAASATHVMVPCGHLALCADCCPSIHKDGSCPVCRQRCEQKIRLYRP